jgi:glycosidase
MRTTTVHSAAWLATTLLAGCALQPAAPPTDLSPVAMQDPGSALAEGWQHGGFMQIFVRAYADSDGDGIGDLRGLIGRLDHLQRLGVRGLWLMPVTAHADGDHGYATTDFRAIAPEYGTLADFDDLLRQAHARGMGVVMDYVINHSAAAHPLFVAARQDRAGPWRDWFVWSDGAPGGWDIWGNNPWYHSASQPWLHGGEPRTLPPPPPGARDFYFATFGPQMPDFNFRHPAVLAYHQGSLRFWLNRGLDGFRLDAVPHLVENSAADWNDQPQSRALTAGIQRLVKAYAKRYTVCEATARPLDYAQSGLCGAAFAFGLETALIQAAQGDAATAPAAVQKVVQFLTGAPPTLGLFLANHDKFTGRRLMDQLRGDDAAYRLAAATYLLLPGTPYIYYGEEIGQAGATGLSGDPEIRGPMSWTADAATAGFTTGRPFRALASNMATHNVAAQEADPHSLLQHYRALLALRNQHPAVARGSFEQAAAAGTTLSFQRRLGADQLLMAYNYGRQPAQLVLAGLPPGAALLPLLATTTTTTTATAAATPRSDGAGRAAAVLGPRSFAVWRVQPAATP